MHAAVCSPSGTATPRAALYKCKNILSKVTSRAVSASMMRGCFPHTWFANKHRNWGGQISRLLLGRERTIATAWKGYCDLQNNSARRHENYVDYMTYFWSALASIRSSMPEIEEINQVKAGHRVTVRGLTNFVATEEWTSKFKKRLGPRTNAI